MAGSSVNKAAQQLAITTHFNRLKKDGVVTDAELAELFEKHGKDVVEQYLQDRFSKGAEKVAGHDYSRTIALKNSLSTKFFLDKGRAIATRQELNRDQETLKDMNIIAGLGYANADVENAFAKTQYHDSISKAKSHISEVSGFHVQQLLLAIKTHSDTSQHSPIAHLHRNYGSADNFVAEVSQLSTPDQVLIAEAIVQEAAWRNPYQVDKNESDLILFALDVIFPENVYDPDALVHNLLAIGSRYNSEKEFTADTPIAEHLQHMFLNHPDVSSQAIRFNLERGHNPSVVWQAYPVLESVQDDMSPEASDLYAKVFYDALAMDRYQWFSAKTKAPIAMGAHAFALTDVQKVAVMDRMKAGEGLTDEQAVFLATFDFDTSGPLADYLQAQQKGLAEIHSGNMNAYFNVQAMTDVARVIAALMTNENIEDKSAVVTFAKDYQQAMESWSRIYRSSQMEGGPYCDSGFQQPSEVDTVMAQVGMLRSEIDRAISQD